MPRERQSITHKFSIGGHEGYITAGMYEDGTVGEIFLTDIGKEGSTLRGMMNSFATAISISLQYGVPLETLVRKFSYMRFEPEGMTSNPEIPFAKSMPDYIMRWLASRFLDVDLQEELGILTKEVRARKAAEDAASSHIGDTARPAGAARLRQASARTPRPATSALTDDPPVLPGGATRTRSRAGLPAVRRHDAAHRQLLHVLQLRLQHRLRLSDPDLAWLDPKARGRRWEAACRRGRAAPVIRSGRAPQDRGRPAGLRPRTPGPCRPGRCV